MRLTKMDHTDIVAAFQAAGYSPAPYSPLAKLDSYCVGVRVEKVPHTVATVMAKNPDQQNELVELFGTVREDSLGRESILYWPNVPWEGTTDFRL